MDLEREPASEQHLVPSHAVDQAGPESVELVLGEIAPWRNVLSKPMNASPAGPKELRRPAAARAARTGLSILGSPWTSQDRYARERAAVSQKTPVHAGQAEVKIARLRIGSGRWTTKMRDHRDLRR